MPSSSSSSFSANSSENECSNNNNSNNDPVVVNNKQKNVVTSTSNATTSTPRTHIPSSFSTEHHATAGDTANVTPTTTTPTEMSTTPQQPYTSAHSQHISPVAVQQIATDGRSLPDTTPARHADREKDEMLKDERASGASCEGTKNMAPNDRRQLELPQFIGFVQQDDHHGGKRGGRGVGTTSGSASRSQSGNIVDPIRQQKAAQWVHGQHAIRDNVQEMMASQQHQQVDDSDGVEVEQSIPSLTNVVRSQQQQQQGVRATATVTITPAATSGGGTQHLLRPPRSRNSSSGHGSCGGSTAEVCSRGVPPAQQHHIVIPSQFYSPFTTLEVDDETAAEERATADPPPRVLEMSPQSNSSGSEPPTPQTKSTDVPGLVAEGLKHNTQQQQQQHGNNGSGFNGGPKEDSFSSSSLGKFGHPNLVLENSSGGSQLKDHLLQPPINQHAGRLTGGNRSSAKGATMTKQQNVCGSSQQNQNQQQQPLHFWKTTTSNSSSFSAKGSDRGSQGSGGGQGFESIGMGPQVSETTLSLAMTEVPSEYNGGNGGGLHGNGQRGNSVTSLDDRVTEGRGVAKERAVTNNNVSSGGGEQYCAGDGCCHHCSSCNTNQNRSSFDCVEESPLIQEHIAPPPSHNVALDMDPPPPLPLHEHPAAATNLTHNQRAPEAVEMESDLHCSTLAATGSTLVPPSSNGTSSSSLAIPQRAQHQQQFLHQQQQQFGSQVSLSVLSEGEGLLSPTNGQHSRGRINSHFDVFSVTSVISSGHNSDGGGDRDPSSMSGNNLGNPSSSQPQHAAGNAERSNGMPPLAPTSPSQARQASFARMHLLPEALSGAPANGIGGVTQHLHPPSSDAHETSVSSAGTGGISRPQSLARSGSGGSLVTSRISSFGGGGGGHPSGNDESSRRDSADHHHQHQHSGSPFLTGKRSSSGGGQRVYASTGQHRRASIGAGATGAALMAMDLYSPPASRMATPRHRVNPMTFTTPPNNNSPVAPADGAYPSPQMILEAQQQARRQLSYDPHALPNPGSNSGGGDESSSHRGSVLTCNSSPTTPVAGFAEDGRDEHYSSSWHQQQPNQRKSPCRRSGSGTSADSAPAGSNSRRRSSAPNVATPSSSFLHKKGTADQSSPQPAANTYMVPPALGGCLGITATTTTTINDADTTTLQVDVGAGSTHDSSGYFTLPTTPAGPMIEPRANHRHQHQHQHGNYLPPTAKDSNDNDEVHQQEQTEGLLSQGTNVIPNRRDQLLSQYGSISVNVLTHSQEQVCGVESARVLRSLDAESSGEGVQESGSSGGYGRGAKPTSSDGIMMHRSGSGGSGGPRAACVDGHTTPLSVVSTTDGGGLLLPQPLMQSPDDLPQHLSPGQRPRMLMKAGDDDDESEFTAASASPNQPPAVQPSPGVDLRSLSAVSTLDCSSVALVSPQTKKHQSSSGAPPLPQTPQVAAAVPHVSSVLSQPFSVQSDEASSPSLHQLAQQTQSSSSCAEPEEQLQHTPVVVPSAVSSSSSCASVSARKAARQKSKAAKAALSKSRCEPQGELDSAGPFVDSVDGDDEDDEDASIFSDDERASSIRCSDPEAMMRSLQGAAVAKTTDVQQLTGRRGGGSNNQCPGEEEVNCSGVPPRRMEFFGADDNDIPPNFVVSVANDADHEPSPAACRHGAGGGGAQVGVHPPALEFESVPCLMASTSTAMSISTATTLNDSTVTACPSLSSTATRPSRGPSTTFVEGTPLGPHNSDDGPSMMMMAVLSPLRPPRSPSLGASTSSTTTSTNTVTDGPNRGRNSVMRRRVVASNGGGGGGGGVSSPTAVANTNSDGYSSNTLQYISSCDEGDTFGGVSTNSLVFTGVTLPPSAVAPASPPSPAVDERESPRVVDHRDGNV